MILQGGVQLSLMIGPIVPRLAPQYVIDALTSVEVTVNDTGRSGFQLEFSLSARSPLHTFFLLSGGSIFPFIRCIIIVIINGQSTVLMDGMITNHQVSPGGSQGKSMLTVTGEDLSVIMDKEELTGFPFPAVPVEGRVALLIAKYSILGLIPKIIPSIMIDVPIPTRQIPAQYGTDLEYIKELARKVGYVFYVEPGPIAGINFAYWGPQIKIGAPQPALNADMDADSNVESLTFTFDNNKNAIPTVYWYEELTKAITMIPIPPITPLSPPLGLIPPIPTRLEPPNDELSKLPFPQAIMMGMAQAAEWQEAVTGEGALDVLRYGRVLQARKLVGVRGVGPAYDGLYYVKKVTHKIKQGEYKQNFTLSRNGLLSTVQRVPA